MEQEFEPKGTLKIRPATADDAQSLINYCFPMMDAEEVTQALQQDVERMSRGEVFRFVVDAGGYAVANVSIEVHPVNPTLAMVHQLAVSPPFRMLDVTSELMAYVDKVAQSKGIINLRVEIPRGETKVIDGYKRWGFSERPVITLEKTLEVQQELEGLEAGGNTDEE